MGRKKIDRKERLITLIEQAASQVTLLTDIEDASELKDCQSVLRQINKEAKAYDEVSDEVQAQFKDVSSQAAKEITNTLKNPDQDAETVINTISSAVSELQALIESVDKPAEEASVQTETETVAEVPAFQICEEDVPLIQDFIAESNEHIESAEGALLDLENDPENEEILNQIFRSFHTIKGMAGFLNLNDISVLAHAAENLLDLARKGELLLTEANCDATFASIDMLKKMLNDLDAALSSGDSLTKPDGFDGIIELLHQLAEHPGQSQSPEKTETPEAAEPGNEPQDDEESEPFPEDDIPLIQDFIVESNEHIEVAEAALLNLENDPNNEEILHQMFRSFHTIKGMAGFLNLTDLGNLAHAAENLLDLARKNELVLTGTNCDATFASIDMLKGLLSDLEKALSVGSGIKKPDNFDSLISTLHACAEGVNAEPEAAEEKSTAKAPESIPAVAEQAAPEPVTDTKTDKKLDNILASKTQKKTRGATATTDEKIKVSMLRLDELINMTGELAIAQLMIAEEVKDAVHNDSDLFRKVSHQDKIVRELQELSMSMRMVPIHGAFQRMSRLVRDLSRKAGKTVQFITSGEETELDRNIVDKITDPLVHMMRNSVDHGLESAEDREAVGKPSHGRVHLSAYHQAGSIVIEIADDGRGLPREKILKKAIEKGLVSENQDISDEEVYRLIFHPGFSTADQISDVSGRGVGMDVVRKNIESLGGKIDIQSVPGKGTTFNIRLPLTLAIIDGQIVTVGQQRYIIPINTVVNSIRPQADQISSIQNKSQMVLIRDELMPLLRLHNLFNVDQAKQDPTEALLVIVEEGDRKCCLLVDDLLGQQQVVIKNLSGLGKIKGISGGAIMGDGLVSLILDVPGLFELAQSN
ncbi:MAG: chemotaxis protein CheA [Planctomycetota bacterium]|jgi:two-component system chemotaxis sensor kinase CheA